ncbi:hypothetical protein [Streptococcus gallolyticus]|uniref:Uncharacterized protein n=1 Tax=Streptococcus gallolyticus TaxID=315405 RepID=A0A1H9VA47_9STRE|nr:hypothetical protein [Streptococcus gallolyticus]SES18107.1 hypothetical protein SAMN04487840_1215 [Streptococcus gallolyticus]
MSRTYNFDTSQDSVVFNVGDVTLEFLPSDEQSKSLQAKADELKERAEKLSDSPQEDTWETMAEFKALLDEFFESMFDKEAPQKLYEAAHKNTMAYIKLFFHIAKALQEVSEERQNDEYFKQFLSE